MNYIKQMNAVFTIFYKDNRLNPTHISLYVSLFQIGNINRFPGSFHINREEVMKRSKIGSKTTYHRCIKQLHHWGYIRYLPSHNPYKGSKIVLLQSYEEKADRVEPFIVPNSGQQVYPYQTKKGTSTKQAVVPYNKHEKHIKPMVNIKKEDVITYFKNEFKKSLPEKKLQTEAEKFFNHNQATGWLLSGNKPIKNWKAAANNWISKAIEIQNKPPKKPNHLKTTKNKNYDTPL